MRDTATPPRAGVYGRQSGDKSRSIAEQIEECTVDCVEQGFVIARKYQDGVSASRFSTKVRDDWPQVLADIEAGKLDVLTLWEPSRGDRDAEQWLGLLRRCREHTVALRITNAQRTYNLAVPRDWKELASDGLDSQYESEKLAGRVRRAMNANAANGKHHGPVPFGYERLYDPVSREFIEQRPHPERAPIVREIIQRIAKGEPIVEVCNDLNARRVPAPAGETWHRSRVRAIATNEAYVGQRRHHGQLTAGTWPPLVTEATFYAAKRVLSDPARKTTKPGRTKHLLSYLATCGVCSVAVHATRRHGGFSYHCGGKGCTSMKMEWFDAYIAELVCTLLSREDVYPALTKADDAAALAARGEARQLRSRLDEFYAAAAGADGPSPAALAAIEARLLPQIEAAERRAVEAATPPALRDLLEPVGDIMDRWESMPIAARKGVVRFLFAKIELLPSPDPGGRYLKFDEERVAGRVDVEWRTP